MSIPQRFLPPMAALRIFEAAARHQNFTSAAQELGLTQGAVSRQIQALEEILGASLFLRDSKNIQLTRAGHIYAKEIRIALKTISTATLGFRANPQGGTLNIALPPTFGTRWLAPRLPDFIAKNPGITINITTKTSLADLQLDGIDALIYFGLPDNSALNYEQLMNEVVIPVCSPSLKEKYQFTMPDDLLHAPLLHLVSRPDAWEQWFQLMGVSFNEVNGMLVDQFALAAQSAISGLGITLLPKFLIEGELQRGELVEAIHAPMESAGYYYLAWQADLTHYPPLTAFKQWLTHCTQPNFEHPTI